MDTRSGEMSSMQIGMMGSINNLANANFKLAGGVAFLLKNDGTQQVELQVRLNGMTEGTFIATKFEVGWNPEIIAEVKQSSLSGLNLKYGY